MALTKFTRVAGTAALALLGALAAPLTHATIVQFQTNLGDFEVNLYDDQTPETVENFLLYVEAEAYQSSLVHRSVAGFVIQGGGFALEEGEVAPVATPWSPVNEPMFANVEATIAMAKQPDDPNSATSQWFINLGDNTDLDHSNGGFTVFGQVVSGMDVVTAIAALDRYNLSGAFNTAWRSALVMTPLVDKPEDLAAFQEGMSDYLVLIEDVVVVDAAPDTAEDLDRPLATEPPKRKKKSGGALNFAWLMLFGGLVGLARVCRRSFDKRARLLRTRRR